MILRGVNVGILSGIHAEGRTDSLAVGIDGVSIHTLGIEVHRQMIVEQRWIQVDRGGVALEFTCTQRTFLIGVTQRDAVGQIFQRACQRHVVVVGQGGAVD